MPWNKLQIFLTALKTCKISLWKNSPAKLSRMKIRKLPSGIIHFAADEIFGPSSIFCSIFWSNRLIWLIDCLISSIVDVNQDVAGYWMDTVIFNNQKLRFQSYSLIVATKLRILRIGDWGAILQEQKGPKTIS